MAAAAVWTVTVLGSDYWFQTEEAADAFRKLLPDSTRSTRPKTTVVHSDPHVAFDAMTRRQTTPVDAIVHDTSVSKDLTAKVVPVVKWAMFDGLGRQQNNATIAESITRMLMRMEAQRIWWVTVGSDYEIYNTDHLEEIRIGFNDVCVTVLTELRPVMMFQGV